MALRIGPKSRCVNDRKVIERFASSVASGSIEKQMLCEHGVPRPFGYNPHADPIFRISACVEVLYEEISPTQVIPDLVLKNVKILWLERSVYTAPPDRILAAGLSDDEFIVGRTARMFARIDDKRPPIRNHPLAPFYGFLEKSGNR